MSRTWRDGLRRPNVTYAINPRATTSLGQSKTKWSGYFIFSEKLDLFDLDGKGAVTF